MHKIWHKVAAFVLILAVFPFALAMAQTDDAGVAEANKEIVRTMLEEIFSAGGDITLLAQYVSPDFIENETGLTVEGLTDFEALAGGLTMLQTAVPDLAYTITEIVAEGDKVAVIGAWTGTHEGEFMGFPATGNTINIPVFDLFRVEDGLIMEHWGVTDNLEFMTQFGAMPMPGSE